MCFFMASSSESNPSAESGVAEAVATAAGSLGSWAAGPRAVAISRRFPSPRIAARSITEPNSRILPGQA